MKFVVTLLMMLIAYILGSCDKAKELNPDEQIAIGPLVAAAAIAGGSSILSNILGKKNQNDANAANLALAREQNQWNEKMWEKTNQWNSPATQAQLLRDAGINPLSTFDNGYTGAVASSPQSADLANQRAFQPDLSGMNSISGYLMQNEELKLAKERNKIEQQRVDNESNMTDAEVALKNAQKEGFDIDNQTRGELNANAVAEGTERIKNLQAQYSATTAQTEMYVAEVGLRKALEQTENELRELRKKDLQAGILVKNKEAEELEKQIVNLILDKDLKALDYVIKLNDGAALVTLHKNEAEDSSISLSLRKATKNEEENLRRKSLRVDADYKETDKIVNYITAGAGVALQAATAAAQGYAAWKFGAKKFGTVNTINTNPSPMSNQMINDIQRNSNWYTYPSGR